MDAWTEIVCEDAGVTHVECDSGEQMVVWPIGSPDEHVLRGVVDQLEQRRAWREAQERFIEQSKQLREQMDRRKEARDQLRAAGYGDDEIPL